MIGQIEGVHGAAEGRQGDAQEQGRVLEVLKSRSRHGSIEKWGGQCPPRKSERVELGSRLVRLENGKAYPEGDEAGDPAGEEAYDGADVHLHLPLRVSERARLPREPFPTPRASLARPDRSDEPGGTSAHCLTFHHSSARPLTMWASAMPRSAMVSQEEWSAISPSHSLESVTYGPCQRAGKCDVPVVVPVRWVVRRALPLYLLHSWGKETVEMVGVLGERRSGDEVPCSA